MRNFFKYFISGVMIVIMATAILPSTAGADYHTYTAVPPDSIPGRDTTPVSGDPVDLPFPIENTGGYPFSNSGKTSVMYLNDPAILENDVEYDPETGEYIFTEKIGERDNSVPVVMSSEEYRKYDFDRSINDYFRQRFRSENFGMSGGLIPKLQVPGDAFADIFGSNTIDIRPQGSAELIFGLQINKIENPVLPIRLQRTTTFDFQEKIQMNVTGSIGDKLKLSTNYNTEATFDFENKMNLKYEGKEDEIIQLIEAGDVNLPLSGSLITGSQSLFGIKTELKFGKLTATTVFSQQKGKTQVIEVEGGAQTSEFEVYADEYEGNKHFFLSQYFRERYDDNLSSLPKVSSDFKIKRVEVWVTNKTGNYEESRNILALMDLGEEFSVNTGESNIYASDFVFPAAGIDFIPYNDQNNLYNLMTTTYAAIREISSISSTLGPLASDSTGFTVGRDYEKIENARKLKETEYTLNRELGYVSLNSALNADEVLAVAYEYTTRGGTFRVGEFSNGDIGAPKVLIVKLLRGTSFTPKFPTWKLMMKNVYALGAYQISPQDFQLNVMYQNDKTGREINYLPEGGIANEILIKVLNLDRVNSNMDPSPDGVYDFMEGITINSSNGRIYFPMLEPFGGYLREKITNGNPADEELSAVADFYVFQELYDSTQSAARQIAVKNKFVLRGRYQSSSSSEIALNAYNIPQGSVKVTAGGIEMTENIDYTVDYNLGRVKILNQGYLESGVPIKISLESNTMFNIQSKTLMGTHLNYKFSDNFNVGATILNLTERPLTQKTNIGDEPISNTIWGINTDYRTESPFLTKMVDKLPFIETKAKSNITVSAEFAHLIPGHPKIKGIDKNGVSYIDDFEGSKTSIDIKSFAAWHIASVPTGNFEEGLFNDSVWYGYNRAKLAWYVIDPILNRKGSNRPSHLTDDQLSNHLTREVYENEIFPKKENEHGIPTNIAVLNLAFYPDQKGPYNFDAAPTTVSAGINASGKLLSPGSRWGGIMRDIQTNDFEAANIEFIEFWVMDPFVYDSTHNGGELYFNLGNISEDILKDSRKAFENGLPTTATPDSGMVTATSWGNVPTQQSLVQAFDNNPEARQFQDVGLDGLGTEEEKLRFNYYLETIKALYGETSAAYIEALSDPGNDNYHYFRGTDFDDAETGILDRYKKYNGLEGNSPTSEQSPESYPTSATTIPDIEDINRDNTLSEAESYFQYKIDLRPETMDVGQNYIYDKIEASVKLENGETEKVNWYQFKIPIESWEKVVGTISDFKSIRFVRMFMTGFDEEIVLRFASIDLVRGEWRKYNFAMREPGLYPAPTEGEGTEFDISAVNIEENGNRSPINYQLPPGVTRVIDPTNPQLRQLNEQSIVLRVCNLEDGDARAAYKNVDMDVRQYRQLELEIHAEEYSDYDLEDGELRAFIRIGSDYQNNFYEYEVPLSVTPPGFYEDNDVDREILWPDENRIDFEFDLLQEVKQKRNDLMRLGQIELTEIYEMFEGNARIRIRGNPNLSNIKTIMIGVRNPNSQTNSVDDDGYPICGEVWMNELRLSDFDEGGGWAAIGRVNARLADFGSVNVAGQTSKPGFGSIEKKVQERTQVETYQYDVASSLELGKFFPEKTGIKVPMHVGFSQGVVNPKYNPLDPDIPLRVALEDPNITKGARDTIKYNAQDFTQRKSLNFTNVKVNKMKGKPKVYDIANWSANYSFSEVFMRNPNTEKNLTKNYRGGIAYLYNTTPKNVMPFQQSKLLKAKSLKLIKEFNFYYVPQQMSFRTDIDRMYNEVQLRNITNPDVEMIIDPTYNKNFTWSRLYDLKYNLTKSLKFDFSATNYARIDEPDGRVDKENYRSEYDSWKDSVMTSLRDFGRTTQYHQELNATYSLPINKIPLFNWISASTGYNTTYDWRTSPIMPDSLDFDPGNTIENTRNLSANLQFNMLNLYNKIGYLEKVNKKYRKKGATNKKEKKFEDVQWPEKGAEKAYVRLTANVPRSVNHKLGTEDVDVKMYDTLGVEIKGISKVINENRATFTADKDYAVAEVRVTGKREVKESIIILVVDNTLRVLMGIKNINVNYNSTDGTYLPGYKPSTLFLGNSNYNGSLAPGIPFVFGAQDKNFGENAGDIYGWLSRDTTIEDQYLMTHNENWRFKVTVEPINDMRIDIDASRVKSKRTTQNIYYYPTDDDYKVVNSEEGGNYTISIITWGTAFEKLSDEDNYRSEAFENFKNYRYSIARQLSQDRLDAMGTGTFTGYDPFGNVDSLTGFPDGYSRTSQDVLIPAFLAAYTKSNPDNNLSKNPNMPAIPKPNWRINYDGLSKVKFVKKYLKTLTLSHAYASSYNVSSYITNLNYKEDEYGDGLNWVRESLSENSDFISKEEIARVAISERFSPLFMVDMTWNNSLITKIEVKKTRNLSLSFSNNQLMDVRDDEFVIGTGYTVPKLELKLNGKTVTSDLVLRLDFSLRKNLTVIRKLEENVDQATNGASILAINFKAEYVLNQRFNVSIFYDRTVNKPKIALSFPQANTKFGVSVRFTLAS